VASSNKEVQEGEVNEEQVEMKGKRRVWVMRERTGLKETKVEGDE
jgi:hypothetical protein